MNAPMTTAGEREIVERARIVAWLRSEAPKYETQYGICVDAIVTDIASQIERGDHLALHRESLGGE